uniref:Serpentine receptor class gamma n=1 Tax=Caenorhabditis tropicalis TaxID=1561998 RepID=A0A1I7UGU9_9PELO
MILVAVPTIRVAVPVAVSTILVAEPPRSCSLSRSLSQTSSLFPKVIAREVIMETMEDMIMGDMIMEDMIMGDMIIMIMEAAVRPRRMYGTAAPFSILDLSTRTTPHLPQFHTFHLQMNSSNDDLIPIPCDPSFDPLWEAVKYLGTVIYLGIGLFLHASILKAIYVTKRTEFRGSSFFQIFALDSAFSILTILTEILFNRLFIYLTPLCPIVMPYYWGPSILPKLVFVSGNYGRFAKSIAQIMMVLNRMSCVLWPINYKNIWSYLTPFCCFLVAVLPVGGTWNLMISRVYVDKTRGGFTMNYIKAVKWVDDDEMLTPLQSTRFNGFSCDYGGLETRSLSCFL